MNPHLTRRSLLRSASCGFGYLAFSALCQERAIAASSDLSAKLARFPARAKRVIFLCMSGGPAQLDTFDYKPQTRTAGYPHI